MSFPDFNLRLVIIYRPPFSETHPMPMSTFFTEFSDYLEAVILSTEELLITHDGRLLGLFLPGGS